LGGALAISLRSGGMFGASPMSGVRLCPACGRYVPLMFPYCTYCGTPAPTMRAGAPVAPPSVPPGNPPAH
ncbi:MAG: hypothetical protein KGL53_11270, partial [Elusimicrobia bacterium]|nr:hypothetical protein [Elusimicrobiota bacterium]